MAPKPYLKTLISNNRSHDIENRVIVTHHNRSIDIENIEPPNHIEPKTDTVQLIICCYITTIYLLSFVKRLILDLHLSGDTTQRPGETTAYFKKQMMQYYLIPL